MGALAESWTVSDDNLVYDIKLREGFTWSDGTPITSADIAYHWEILNNPEAAHPQAWLLDTLSSLEVIDEYNIRITVQ
ncbi:MAG UNVERIFIED_CONTAM: ABC transporter substrate-binding protein [Anaerolineae bacterium]